MPIISIHDYNVINACKRDDNMKSLKEYLKDYYIVDEVNDLTIFNCLTELIFSISTYEDIKHLYKEEFIRFYQGINRNKENDSINIHNLVTMLYYHLYFLTIMKCKEKKENDKFITTYEDIYYVNDEDKFIPYSEYHSYQKTKKRFN